TDTEDCTAISSFSAGTPFGMYDAVSNVRQSPSSIGIRRFLGALYKRWDTPRSLFGDLVVLGFVLVQCLDAAFTYLGMRTLGPGIEGNPLVSTAVAIAGLGAGLAGTKLVAIGFGMLLHLNRVHNLVALLTAIYLAAAIVPWTAILVTHHILF